MRSTWGWVVAAALVALTGCGSEAAETPDAAPDAPSASSVLVAHAHLEAVTSEDWVVFRNLSGGVAAISLAGGDAVPLPGPPAAFLGGGHIARARDVVLRDSAGSIWLWSYSDGPRELGMDARVRALADDGSTVVYLDVSGRLLRAPGTLATVSVLESTEACADDAQLAAAAVIYSHCQPGSPMSRDLRIADASGVRTAQAASARWSLDPGGTRVLAVDATGTLQVLAVDGSSSVTVAGGVVDARFYGTGDIVYLDTAGGLWRTTIGQPGSTSITSDVFALADVSPDRQVVWFHRSQPAPPFYTRDLAAYNGLSTYLLIARAAVVGSVFLAQGHDGVIIEQDAVPKFAQLTGVYANHWVPICTMCGHAVLPIDQRRFLFEADYGPPDAGPAPTSVDLFDLARRSRVTLAAPPVDPLYWLTADRTRLVTSDYAVNGDLRVTAVPPL